MKTIRHTVNVPAQMELPKRPIAKAFANASWQQQHRAIENILTLRKEGWRGVDLQPHFDAVTQVENVA